MKIASTPRQGKTLMLTRYAYRAYKLGFKVYANYPLYFQSVFMDSKFILDMFLNNVELNGVFLAFDEIQQLIDKRMSGNKKNIFMSYLVWQTSKKKNKLYYTTQQPFPHDKLDLLRNAIDFRLDEFNVMELYCMAIRKDPLDLWEDPKGIYIKRFIKPIRYTDEFTVMNPQQYYKLYPTQYVINYDEEDFEVLKSAKSNKKRRKNN